MVDEFVSVGKDTGEMLILGDERCQVTQSLSIRQRPGDREPGGTHLRAWWTMQELGCGCLRFVFEVAGHDQGAVDHHKQLRP